MLIQEELEPQDPNYQELETISKETLRCRKIVTSLLDFARQSTPTRKPCDINDIVKDSFTLTQKQAVFKDVELKYEIDENIPPLSLDKGQIQQAIINLIINAIESTDAGGSIYISTAYNPLQERVEIAVSDTGQGIEKNDLDKIFDPFFTSKDEGTGLGLAITHGIIEQHNGKIDAFSKVGRGTIFTIKLPIESGENDAV
jgi:signal transduction histidine kinase